jgi:hypothetical protein
VLLSLWSLRLGVEGDAVSVPFAIFAFASPHPCPAQAAEQTSGAF